jgi:Predicted nucleotide-binding protein containing TIR-like domain
MAVEPGVMSMHRIFVGSSTEAIELARSVGVAIAAAGMTPIVWDTRAFPVGSTLLERIESLADEFEGAVLLFTPDVHSVRSGHRTREPISNVMFEYGYLSARLTRRRVAICLFEDAVLPSDLQGVKVINAGAVGYRKPEARGVGYSAPELPAKVIDELSFWLSGLSRRAEDIPPVVQLHGYSGIWDIETRFNVWRGLQVTPPNEVFWYGFTFLFIPPTGRGGKGTMYGSTHIDWTGYRARYDVVNEVREATVDEYGTLTLRVLVLRRQLLFEEGTVPDNRLHADLPEKEFYVRLAPVPGEPRELRGVHNYTRGIESYQVAEERYRRIE